MQRPREAWDVMRVLRFAVLLSAISIAAGAQSLTEPVSNATLVNADLDAGDVSAGVSADLFANVLIDSSTPWHLKLRNAVTTDPAAPGEERSPGISFWAGERWNKVSLSSPLIVAESAVATRDAVVPIRLRISPSFDDSPGERKFSFALELNDRPVAASLRVRYRVLATVSVTTADRAFSLTAEPARGAEWEFEARVYTVKSNVPWSLDVWMAGGARSGSTEVPARTFSVATAGGRWEPLSRRVTVADGAASGETGVAIPVRIRVRAEGAIAAGEYATDLDVEGVPRAARQ